MKRATVGMTAAAAGEEPVSFILGHASTVTSPSSFPETLRRLR
jgi:hypothetical protein